MAFVHLRNLSSYSLARGMLHINQLVELARTAGQGAVGIMDYDNFFGALEFSLEAAAKGVQPIIGINIQCQYRDWQGRSGFIALNERGFIIYRI